MKWHSLRLRPGLSLVEVILTVALVAALTTIVVSILFSVSEERVLEQSTSVIEQGASEMLQTLGVTVRGAERITGPVPFATGAVLMLQTWSGALDPIVIGIMTGRLVLAEHSRITPISSNQVIVTAFTVRNTSTSGRSQGASVSFTLTHPYVMLGTKPAYVRTFTTSFSLFPADDPVGNPCGCGAPLCFAHHYQWNICTTPVTCGTGPKATIQC